MHLNINEAMILFCQRQSKQYQQHRQTTSGEPSSLGDIEQSVSHCLKHRQNKEAHVHIWGMVGCLVVVGFLYSFFFNPHTPPRGLANVHTLAITQQPPQ